MFNINPGGQQPSRGIDYIRQNYRGVTFVKGGSKYIELKTNRSDDDLVEIDEVYCLKIEDTLLPSRVKVCHPNETRIILVNEDGKCICM